MPQPIDFMRMIQQIRRRYAESLRPLERRWMLTGNEIDVLLFLANNPGDDTARDAVEMRGLSKSHVCKSVDALTKRGWLAGEQDKRDRRCVHLRLLPPAVQAVEECRLAQRAFLGTLYGGVTDDELETMERVLHKLEHNIKGGSSWR